MRQLIFNLARPPSHDLDDFLEAQSNTEAFSIVRRWPAWPHHALLLVGPEGSGKSHLGAIWAAEADARTISANDRLMPDPCFWPSATFVEDCDRAEHGEAELFHLLNLAGERRGWLLLSARTPPDRWQVRTPDLLSRLRLAPMVQIGQPDASLMRAVIVKLFADRQIHIDEDIVAYAARHCEQSLDAVNKFVAAVDDASLAAGRRITRPLAAEAIAKLSRDEPALDSGRDLLAGTVRD